MIESLDETIKELLVEKMPLNLSEVDVAFDVPNREWSGSISKPTINIYLHDIRENVELRGTASWFTERDADGKIARGKFGRLIDLSYLITAWTTNVEDEHRLLWYVLSTLVRFPVIPKEVCQGPLADEEYPLHTKVAQPDSILRNAADVWTALDNQLKPVLSYVITVPLDSYIISKTFEVRTRFLRFHMPTVGSPVEVPVGAARNGNGHSKIELATIPATIVAQQLQVGGFVRAADGKPLQGAEVVLLEQGLNVRTDAQGRYSFGYLAERPQYTFLVIAPGYVTARQVIVVPVTSYDIELEPEQS
jgi:hypothetical protein